MEDNKHHGRRLIAKNSIFNLAGQILPMLVGVLTIPYIIRGLGTDGYGILSLAFLVLGYFNIFDLGLSRATVKFVAENMSPDKLHRVPELVWTSLILLSVMGCTGAILASVLVPVSVTHWLKMPPSFVHEARIALFALCASMPIMLANNCLRGVLEAAQRFDLVNYVKVPSSVLFYLVAAAVIPFGVHVPGIIALMILVRLLSTCAYLLFCFRIIPGLRTHFTFSRAAMHPLATFGGWVMISNITGPVFGYLERFMIASVLSVSMLTFYTAPYELVSKILIFPMSIVPSLFPYFSYHGTERSTEVSEVTSRAAKYLLLVLTPLAAVFIFFAKDILQLWLGQPFAAQSTRTLQLVTILFFVNAFGMIPYTSVQALGRADLKAILDLSVLPVYVILSWWLMRRLGINGAALAKLLITISDCIFLYTFASKLKAFSIRDCFSGPLFRAILASGTLLAALFAISNLNATLLVSIPLVIICFVTYVLAFWMVAVDEEDKITINGWSRKACGLLTRRRSPATIPIVENDAGV